MTGDVGGQQLQDTVAVGLVGERDVDGQANRRRVRVRDGVDASGKKLGKLGLEKCPYVRRIQKAMDLVEQVAAIGIRRDEIREDDPAARARHADHLADRLRRVCEVMK